MDVNDTCPRSAALRAHCVSVGFCLRQDHTKRIQRWACTKCGKKFSASTFKITYRQKLRRINQTIRIGLASNMWQGIDIFIDMFCDRPKLLDVSVRRDKNADSQTGRDGVNF